MIDIEAIVEEMNTACVFAMDRQGTVYYPGLPRNQAREILRKHLSAVSQLEARAKELEQGLRRAIADLDVEGRDDSARELAKLLEGGG